MADPFNTSGAGTTPQVYTVTNFAFVGGKVVGTLSDGKQFNVAMPQATLDRVTSVAYVSSQLVRLTLNSPTETQDVAVDLGSNGIAKAIQKNTDRIKTLEESNNSSGDFMADGSVPTNDMLQFNGIRAEN
jgi:hypothetical protein